MRDEILLEFEKQIRENKEAIEAFSTAINQMKKGFNLMAAVKTMDEMKELSGQREILINGLLEYIVVNYSD